MRRILIGVAVIGALAVVGVLAWGSVSSPVEAVAPEDMCTFTEVDMTWYLDGDCYTDETILVPDGYTLNGMNHTITAVDPDVGHFVGAVVMNGGDEAHVMNLNVTTVDLANACDGGSDRLRGIMFEGASGTIMHNNVYGVNQGPSGCQEGNAIEVRNAPFDGTHLGTVVVEVSHNDVMDYQKGGIIANGDVDVDIHHNHVSSSATQENLAANSVQFGFGAMGLLTHNHIDGNEWLGASNYAASAVLLYLSEGVEVEKNNIGGNSEVGIWDSGTDSTIINNRVFDEGVDGSPRGYDWGIGAWGQNPAEVKNNKVRGFEYPYDGVEGGKNKVIQGPQNINPWF